MAPSVRTKKRRQQQCSAAFRVGGSARKNWLGYGISARASLPRLWLLLASQSRQCSNMIEPCCSPSKLRPAHSVQTYSTDPHPKFSFVSFFRTGLALRFMQFKKNTAADQHNAQCHQGPLPRRREGANDHHRTHQDIKPVCGVHHPGYSALCAASKNLVTCSTGIAPFGISPRDGCNKTQFPKPGMTVTPWPPDVYSGKPLDGAFHR